MSEQTFEAKLNTLEKIVGQLEEGEVPLGTAMEAFAEGTKLVKSLQNELQTAEQNLTKMVQEDGTEVPFDVEGK
ncbi:exodeoxyribonuclease VII small subunit [Weissella coleopterorum]|uniref:Exodeoxyribonuclease 7 small subunit n=1 Tax=Weissella coleopterorum TaxID=2714949 RepID=A0A6G8AZI6_9LACO|nr:exodeoxyribonuclease VII small subunit [Weissella coleopterorum]QIL50416.1 exodeoxyribonuclease VII small subunit [Weissella coleopterorum]